MTGAGTKLLIVEGDLDNTEMLVADFCIQGYVSSANPAAFLPVTIYPGIQYKDNKFSAMI
jgi:hypothetical protein